MTYADYFPTWNALKSMFESDRYRDDPELLKKVSDTYGLPYEGDYEVFKALVLEFIEDNAPKGEMDEFAIWPPS